MGEKYIRYYCPLCEKEVETTRRICPICGKSKVITFPGVIKLGSLFEKKYLIEKPIAQGGMGIVFKGEHVTLGSPIAIKVLKPEIADSDESVARFIQEGKILSSLKHHNTIRVLDAGRHESGLLYIVMEYLEGYTLKELLEREKRIDYKLLCKIGIQVCKSLREAHQKGLIHRDLKPEHIFFDEVIGENFFVKVIDFGIAKNTDPSDPTVSRTGATYGTPAYMSPEQIEGGKLDARSDIYSLGLIFFEALTGDVLFTGHNPVSIMIEKLNFEPIHIREKYPKLKIPRELDNLIFRMLQRDKEKRPASIEEVLGVLEKIIGYDEIRETKKRYLRGLDEEVRDGEPRDTIAIDSDSSVFDRINCTTAFDLKVDRCLKREEEKAKISEFLDFKIRNKEGGVIEIFGSTGVGKSKLVDWIVENYEDCCTVVKSEFIAISNTLTMKAVKDFVFSLIDSSRSLTFGITQEVSAGLKMLGIERNVREVIIDFLNPSLTRRSTLSSEKKGEYWEILFSSLLLFFKKISEMEPIVLIVDDFQWADEKSIQFFSYLVNFIKNFELKIIFIYIINSDELEEKKDVNEFIHWNKRYIKGNFLKLEISNFTKEDTKEFLKYFNLTNENDIEFLYNKTLGNPLYLVEFIGFLYQKNLIVKDEEDGFYIDVKKYQHDFVPVNLKSLVQSRLQNFFENSRFKEYSKYLMTILSVYGDKIRSRVLKEIVIKLKKGMIVENFEEIIDELIFYRILKLEVDRLDTYISFFHPMLRVVLLEGFEQNFTIQKINRAIAEVLESRKNVKNPDIAEKIAFHYQAAGDFEKAVNYFLYAGKVWFEKHNFDKAMESFSMLFNLVGEDEDEFKEEILTAFFYLARVHFYKNRIDTAEQEIREVLRKAHESKNELYSDALVALADILMAKGDYENASSYLERAVNILKEKVDNTSFRSKMGIALKKLGDVTLRKDGPEAALPFYRRAIEIFESIDSLLNLALTYNSLGLLHAEKGEVSFSDEYFSKAIDIYRKLNNPFELARFYNNVAIKSMFEHDYDRAINFLKRAEEALEKFSFNFPKGVIYINFSDCYLQKKKVEEAKEYLYKAQRIAEKLMNPVILEKVKTHFAYLEYLEKNYEVAKQYVFEALELSEQIKNPIDRCNLYLLAGEIYKSEGFLREALEFYELGINIGVKNGIKNKNVKDGLKAAISICETLKFPEERKRYETVYKELFES